MAAQSGGAEQHIMDGCGRVPERLLVLDIVNAYGAILLQTVWEVTPGITGGRRRTDVERIAVESVLRARLDQLLPLLFPQLPSAVPNRAAA